MQCYCKLKIKKLLLSYAQNAEGNVLSSTAGNRIDKDRGFAGGGKEDNDESERNTMG